MRDFFQADLYIKQLEQSESISLCDAVPIPDIGENQNYLFISYSHIDYKKVYADLAKLYQAGVRFWYDKGLSAGKNWDTEIKSKIESSRCCGVIFYISENSFLSKSINQEIDLVIRDNKEASKNYFCVNLTDKQPSHILRSILRMDDEMLDKAGIDMDGIATLSKAFSDKQTYLSYSSIEHEEQLLRQIEIQFDVMNHKEENRGYFVIKGSENVISIKGDDFFIGRDSRMCDYCFFDDKSVSRINCCITKEEAGDALIDMKSTNGTYHNGIRLKEKEPVILKDGDVVKIGKDTILIYHTT